MKKTFDTLYSSIIGEMVTPVAPQAQPNTNQQQYQKTPSSNAPVQPNVATATPQQKQQLVAAKTEQEVDKILADILKSQTAQQPQQQPNAVNQPA
jgi:hypothetical protein